MANRNSRKSGKNRREQTPKTGNRKMMEGMQELRFSNASGFHKSANDYRRKPKHANRGWDS